MYINSLIYLLAKEALTQPVTKTDTNYKIIDTLSKYQQPIHNYKADSHGQQKICATVEEVLANLLNATKKDIEVLSYKKPEFSSFRNFPIVSRLQQYVLDLNLLRRSADLWINYDMENASDYLEDIDATIHNGLAEIKHSYNVIEQAVKDDILPRLDTYNTTKNGLLKTEINELAQFADAVSKKLNRAEPSFRYEVIDSQVLGNLKSALLVAYNKTKEEDFYDLPPAEIEQMR